MKKNSFLLFFLWLMIYVPTLAVNIKVSDQYPTLLALSGRIEKISFGNGHQEYVAKEEGRFLEVKAKHPKTSTTTITVFYLSNEGKKNEKIDVFYGTISYDAGIQPMYDLTTHKAKEIESSEKWDIEEPLTDTLSEALTYIDESSPNIKRFYQAKQKVRCTLVNALSTGNDIILKFMVQNHSPYTYKLGKVYFLLNHKDKTPIPVRLKPKRVVVEPGQTVPIIFVMTHKVEQSGIIVRFEEKKGRRDLSLKLPNRLLLNIPCFMQDPKAI